MEQPAERPHRNLQIELPAENEAGVPADFARLWHTQSTFVIDFVAMKSPPISRRDPETDREVSDLPVKVVSRIRIPPEQVFELASALTKQLDAWERETGRRPTGQG